MFKSKVIYKSVQNLKELYNLDFKDSVSIVIGIIKNFGFEECENIAKKYDLGYIWNDKQDVIEYINGVDDETALYEYGRTLNNSEKKTKMTTTIEDVLSWGNFFKISNNRFFSWNF